MDLGGTLVHHGPLPEDPSVNSYEGSKERSRKRGKGEHLTTREGLPGPGTLQTVLLLPPKLFFSCFMLQTATHSPGPGISVTSSEAFPDSSLCNTTSNVSSSHSLAFPSKNLNNLQQWPCSYVFTTLASTSRQQLREGPTLSVHSCPGLFHLGSVLLDSRTPQPPGIFALAQQSLTFSA